MQAQGHAQGQGSPWPPLPIPDGLVIPYLGILISSWEGKLGCGNYLRNETHLTQKILKTTQRNYFKYCLRLKLNWIAMQVIITIIFTNRIGTLDKHEISFQKLLFLHIQVEV